MFQQFAYLLVILCISVLLFVFASNLQSVPAITGATFAAIYFLAVLFNPFPILLRSVSVAYCKYVYWH